MLKMSVYKSGKLVRVGGSHTICARPFFLENSYVQSNRKRKKKNVSMKSLDSMFLAYPMLVIHSKKAYKYFWQK